MSGSHVYCQFETSPNEALTEPRVQLSQIGKLKSLYPLAQIFKLAPLHPHCICFILALYTQSSTTIKAIFFVPIGIINYSIRIFKVFKILDVKLFNIEE